MFFVAGSVSIAQIVTGKPSSPKKPEITYEKVDVKNVLPDKVCVDFVFLVNNPNTFGIDNVFADYELFLKKQPAGSGKDMKFDIAAAGKSELKMPMEILYSHAFKSSEELTKAVLSGQKTIPFRLETKFKIPLGILRVEIPVTATGDLPLPEIRSTPTGKALPKPKFH